MHSDWCFNHAAYARLNPQAYCGTVDHAELGPVTVRQAAEHVGCTAILQRVGNWVLTECGVECLRVRLRIPSHQLWTRDWFSELRIKPWFSPNDVIDLPHILDMARQRWPREDATPPPPPAQ